MENRSLGGGWDPPMLCVCRYGSHIFEQWAYDRFGSVVGVRVAQLRYRFGRYT